MTTTKIHWTKLSQYIPEFQNSAEAAWTRGMDVVAEEDDITSTRGSRDLPFMPAVAVTSWERIEQEAGLTPTFDLHKQEEREKMRAFSVCHSTIVTISLGVVGASRCHVALLWR
ncbi:hypothetical protein E3U43_020831 [Larimichthys crocea]|uniref:Uncharacterized protein n=1 Tax=Larimichthys crocea TaxID=215358 RepID=A0ACD3Q830_LARCR|nr:hypothetical protein E3U43_020831 [Larimichthys crocea]